MLCISVHTGVFAQAPRFTEPVYRASVPETFVAGGFERPPDGFVQVACIDADTGTALDATYTITDTNVGPFSLNPGTGALSVTTDLDYETETFYSLNVICISASDLDLNNTVVVEITIESVNEFEPLITSILTVVFTEEEDVGALIVSHRPGEGFRQFSVSDGDDGPHGNVTFTFSDDNDPTDVMYFNLDLLTGDVTLRERVDVDSVPGDLITLRITITACDSFPSESDCPNLAIVFIVFAANDNQPHFSQPSYVISLHPLTPINATVLVAECTDADVGVGMFQGIEFESVSDPEMWMINNTDGTLKLNMQLDSEITRYEFTLRCFDTDGIQDIVSVVMNVQPVIIQFSQSSYEATFSESTPIHATLFVAECTSTYMGVGVFQEIEFQSVTDPEMWSLNNMNGTLQLNRHFDYENAQKYQFSLRCFDTYGIQATVPVTVNVLPVNDNPPVFNKRRYSFTASRLSPPGDEEVGQVVATDADLVIGNIITYSISDSDNFAIDQNDGSGVITVSDYIFTFEGSTFELIVYASDGVFQATASVEVTVEGLLSIPEIIIIAISGAVLIVIICIFACCCCCRWFPKYEIIKRSA